MKMMAAHVVAVAAVGFVVLSAGEVPAGAADSDAIDRPAAEARTPGGSRSASGHAASRRRIRMTSGTMTLVMAGCGESSEVKEYRAACTTLAEAYRIRVQEVPSKEEMEQTIKKFKKMSPEARQEEMKCLKSRIQYEEAQINIRKNSRN